MRSLESRVLRLAEAMQDVWEGYGVRGARQAQVDLYLARTRTATLIDPVAHKVELTPPLHGLHRLVLPAGIAFAAARAAVFAHAAAILGGEDEFYRGSAASKVVGILGILTVEECRSGRADFYERKTAFLRAHPYLWKPQSFDFLLGVADNVRAQLAARVPVQAAPSGRRLRTRSAKHAYELGLVERKHSNPTRARRLFEDAIRLGRESGDWRAVALGYLNLGLLQKSSDLGLSERLIRRAASVARRHRLRQILARALHDLAAVAIEGNRFDTAERRARRAFHLYKVSDPRRAALCYDVAYMWLERGSAQASLRVLNAILPQFRQPGQRLLALATIARAAASAGEFEMFDRVWPQAWALVDGAPPHLELAPALVELVRAFYHAGDCARASEAAHRAIAAGVGQERVVRIAREVLTVLAERATPEAAPPFAEEVIQAFLALS